MRYFGVEIFVRYARPKSAKYAFKSSFTVDSDFLVTSQKSVTECF